MNSELVNIIFNFYLRIFTNSSSGWLSFSNYNNVLFSSLGSENSFFQLAYDTFTVAPTDISFGFIAYFLTCITIIILIILLFKLFKWIFTLIFKLFRAY